MLPLQIYLPGWISLMMAKASERISGKNDSTRESMFNDILLYHDNMIKRICFGYSDSREELQDLYQDVMLNLWKALATFRGEASLKTWTYRIALNTCVSTIRRKKRIDEFAKIDSLVAQDIVEENNTEFLVELHEVISRLSPVDRALMLMWLEEINYEEIASTIGLPRNTVATRLRRAKEKIKKQFSF